MDTYKYHHYLFFDVQTSFYHLPADEQSAIKAEFEKFLSSVTVLKIVPYATLGFKKGTTFMLWCRAETPNATQDMLRDLMRTKFALHLILAYSYFGMSRDSEYSGRQGKPEQVMQSYEDRLPYFVLYPFTKTSDWHVLDGENRKSIMGQHIKIGLGHPDIRQCLLYSYGVDDYEFFVSYEMKTFEEFQDLVIQMRRTIGRKYTLVDTPTFSCIYKPLDELVKWI